MNVDEVEVQVEGDDDDDEDKPWCYSADVCLTRQYSPLSQADSLYSSSNHYWVSNTSTSGDSLIPACESD